MDYRQLGQTELRVSHLSLGTVSLGLRYGIGKSDGEITPPSLNEAAQLLHKAVDAGINFIDTARAYGSSEEVIGQVLAERRDEILLATKVHCLDDERRPLRGKALRQRVQESVETSLNHLKTDHIDLLMIHSAPVTLLAEAEALAALKEVQAQGLVRHIGASTYGSNAPRLAIEQGAEVLQVAYNVLDQRMGEEIFPLAQQEGVGIVVRSVYLKGALTDRAEDLPAHLEPLKKRSRQFRAAAAGLTPPLTAVEAALRFVLANPDIHSVLVGVRTEEELDMALSAAEAGSLTAESVDQLGALRWHDSPLLDPSTWGVP